MNEELEFRPVYWRIAPGSIMPFAKDKCQHTDRRPHSATSYICLGCGDIQNAWVIRSITTGPQILTPEQLQERTK